MIHFFRITAATALIMLCTVLPFLPGRYDALAVPLSLMCQIFGKAGLLLVPVGAIWMASMHRSRLAQKHDLFAIVALIACSVVWALVSVGALVSSGFALGLGALLLWAYVVWRIWPRLRPSAPPRHASAIPLYMIVVPVAAALLQVVLAEPVAEFSRSRAIRNSAPLIADIEQYRATHGRYPASLLSVNPDYLPWVIGIDSYHYEPSGEAYNLFFEQFTFVFGTREFVVYNPRDRQVMTSHKMDLLQRAEQLELRRGYYAVHETRHPHWKYFWFD